MPPSLGGFIISCMRTSLWYKQFGGKREERYYHITGIEEEGPVSGTRYTYDSVLHKVTGKEPCSYDSKWWMEQEVSNAVHEVAESTVPFLMGF